MGKFLKKIENENIRSGKLSITENAVIQHNMHQPLHGKTIFLFENPNTEETRVRYFEPKEDMEIDHKTKFTFRFEDNEENEYPCVYITFQSISPSLKNENCVVCLETNSLTEGAYKSLNVYDAECNLLPENENITYIRLSNIVLNIEYPLYITAPWYRLSHYIVNQTNAMNKRGCEFPFDTWTVNFNIRPSIRYPLGHVNFIKYLPDFENVTVKLTRLMDSNRYASIINN